jgi:hypothetical protein
MNLVGPVFMIVFDDRDVPPEVFGGEQAELGARARFERVLTNWNANLFQRIDDGRRPSTGAQRRGKVARHCVWQRVEDERLKNDYFRAGCPGLKSIFIRSDTERWKFCPYCGKPIRISPPSRSDRSVVDGDCDANV